MAAMPMVGGTGHAKPSDKHPDRWANAGGVGVAVGALAAPLAH
jgi:hypothetical protein